MIQQFAVWLAQLDDPVCYMRGALWDLWQGENPDKTWETEIFQISRMENPSN